MNKIKKQEKEKILLKIIQWSQRRELKVEILTKDQILEAIRCKL